jgi:glutathione S-transferase
MKPRLISFKLCPFVQKAVLTLLQKQVDFDIEYIDLDNPPQWFLDLSPLGRVPVLQVGDEVLFESSVIVEYLDEVHPPSLHPADPLQKAQNRSWIEFGNECLMNGFQLVMADDETTYREQTAALLDKLDRLEARLGGGPFFNGAQPALVDLCYIPLFQRLEYCDEACPGPFDYERHPKLHAWRERLMALPVVKDSTVPEIRELYRRMMQMKGGFLGQRIDLGEG